MTLKQARIICMKWQERLRLMDWDVKIRWATKDEEKQAWGLCDPDIHAKTSTIVLANPRHPDWKNQEHPRDPETIIVHELLHLHHALFEFKEGSSHQVIEENIVNQLARLLIALDRGDESVMNGGRPLSRVASIKSA